MNWRDIGSRIARWALAVLFLVAGLLHFLKPAFYLQIMPPYLPYPRALVLISGGFEILGGVGLLVPRVSRLAAWGIIALLVVFMMPHIYMIEHPERFASIPTALLWLRLPIQGLFILWAYVYTRPVDLKPSPLVDLPMPR